MTLPIPSQETLARLTALKQSPAGRRVGVLGLGVSGKAMALYLARRGARVVGVDAKSDVPAAADLRAAGVELRLGAVAADRTADLDGLLLSPGVDPRQPAVAALLARGAPVFGELELTSPLPAKVAGITGTNGKSTTTGLLGALVQGAGLRAFVGGNFGEPVCAWLDRGEAADVAVIELSSFQLETVFTFSADVAVELNVTPDHLDRYDGIEGYARAKQRLVETLAPTGVAVLAHEDAAVRAMAGATRGKVWWLATRGGPVQGHGAWLEGNTMVTVGEPSDLGRIDLSHPRLFGRHNRENAIAAFLSARALGVTDVDALTRAYRAFQGLEHRLELAGDVGGVRFINDSKATNDDAAAIAVAAMDRPTILLLGGHSKGGGYAGVLGAAPGKVKVVVAYGEARDEIAAAFAAHPGLVVAPTIAQAFREAVTRAVPGDAVLLAPACSSYDEFTDYTQRGRTFKRWVRELGEGKLP